MEFYLSNDKNILGPIFISKRAIIELNDRIKDIDELLSNSLKEKIKQNIEESKNKSYNEGKSNIELEIMATPPKYKNRKLILVYTGDGARIELESIDDLIKQDALKNYKFSSIAIKIIRDDKSFHLYIRHKIESISYESSGLSESEKKEVYFQINEWINTVLPSKAIVTWTKLDEVLKFISIFGLVSIVTIYFLLNVMRNDGDYYRSEIKTKMIELIESSKSQSIDLNYGINLLLQFSSDYYPKEYIRPKINTYPFLIIIMICVCLFIVSFSPKTKFELGNEIRSYNNQMIWTKAILYIIPVMIIVPIIINLITK